MLAVLGVDRELAHPLALAAGARARGRRPAAAPPASAIAAVSLPSGSWRASSSTRIVTLYWALTAMGGYRIRFGPACPGMARSSRRCSDVVGQLLQRQKGRSEPALDRCGSRTQHGAKRDGCTKRARVTAGCAHSHGR